ncbi:MAG: hypothetical protein V1746_02605, partial [bacterium]
ILFLQGRPNAGPAQTSLAELFADEKIRAAHPALLTGAEGWLTNVCEQYNIPFLMAHFPNPHSFLGRLRRNKWFAHELKRLLRYYHREWQPALVVANELEETRLAVKLAQRLKTPCAAILRAPNVTRRDYEKNQCQRCAMIFAATEELKKQIASWNSSQPAHLITDLPLFLPSR